MPRRRLRRVRPAIQRLDPHALHQRRDVLAADMHAFATQHVAQHPAARERIVQMQFVDAAHDRQICGRHRPRLVVDAAAADVQNLRLAGNRQSVRTVDHRFALSMPALLSAPSKKSFSSVSSPILACKRLQIDAGAALRSRRVRTRPPRLRAAGLPWRDLVRVNIEKLRQFGQRLLAFDRRQCHFRLEGRCVVAAWSSRHGLS